MGLGEGSKIMKQTFNIPEGCKVVTVEQIGNQLITSFEPEKYVPKVGDCVKMQYKTLYFPTFCLIDKFSDGEIFAKNVWINAKKDKNDIKFENSNFIFYDSIEKITPEEFQSEFDKLGYVYDFETHTAHKKRWRAEAGDCYFYIDFEYDVLSCRDHRDSVDNCLFKNGNYFQSQSDAEKFAEIIKKEAINFHKNNQ